MTTAKTKLENHRVIDQSRLEGAVIHADAGRQLVVTQIETTAFEDYFGRPRIEDEPRRRLSKRECNLLATSNLELLAPLIQAKIDAEDHGFIGADPHRFVELTLEDLQRSPTKLSDRVLEMADRSGWVGSDGRVGSH